MRASIGIKRIQAPAAAEDGVRVLVDRLWPRGLRKADARIDHWLKDVAPSPELRRWFGHDPERWPEFQRRYRTELQAEAARLAALLDLCEDPPVTLLYAARDRAHNHAIVLRDVLLERLAAENERRGSSPCDLPQVRAQFGLGED